MISNRSRLLRSMHMRLFRRHSSGFIELGRNAAQLNGLEVQVPLAKSTFSPRSPKTREDSPVSMGATGDSTTAE